MALTKVINDLADLNQSGSTNALKGCVGTTAQQPASSSSIDYLIVGGGGGAGGGIANSWGGGGGGAGGYLTGSTTVYHGTPTVITVGEGGNGNNVRTAAGFNGDDSGFNGIRAIGGGGGGAESIDAVDGASGGGAGGNLSGTASQPGSSVSGQGNAGGGVASPVNGSASGGGGGGAVGSIPSTSSVGGAGGIGVDQTGFISVVNANLAQIGDTSNATQVMISGGGGGASDYQTGGNGGTGGLGGGGNGGNDGTNSGNGIAGTSNTGGGGGGGNADPSTQALGGTGGSGVGVLKYDNTIVTGYTLNSEDTYTVNWPADKYGVVYWPLNLNVKDVGGHYDGTATDITYTNGKFNQAASFNGSSSYIERTNFGTIVNTSNAFSFSFWAYFNSISTYDWVIGIQQAGSPYAGVGLFGNASNKLGIAVAGAGPQSMTDTLSLSTWMHIAFTHDGSGNYKCYVDGGTPITYSGVTSSNSANPLRLGLSSVSGWDYFDGILEQVRIYTSELSLTDVQDIYNNSKPGSLPPLKPSSDLTYNVCDYPSSSGSQGLFIFDGDITDTCSNITFTAASNGSLVSSYGTGKFASQSALWNGTQSSSGNTMETSYAWLSNSGAFTISLWVKYEEAANPAYQSLLWGNTSDWGTHGGILIYIYGASNSSYPNQVGVTFAASTGLGSPTWREYFTIPGGWANNWVHLAISQDSAGLKKMYINGIKVDEDTSAVTTIGEYDLTFGGYNGYTNDKFKGDMSNLRIYNESLSDQHVYDLWQKENSIQTYFPDTPTSGTDTLVFKEGSGEITFKNDSPPGAEVGMLRYNTTLDQMEHFNSGGWKDFTSVYCYNESLYSSSWPTTVTAFWNFNNNVYSNPTTYNPTSTANLTYTAGKFGSAVYFNGTEGTGGTIVSGIPTALGTAIKDANGVGNGAFTFSVWLNPTQTAKPGTYDPDIIRFLENMYLRIIYLDGGTVQLYVNDSTSTTSSVTSAALTPNQWTHICATGSSNGIALYINGIKVGADSWNGTFQNYYNANYSTTAIGCARNFGGQPPLDPHSVFPGSMDQFRIFTSQLTDAQVLQLYNEVYCP